MRSVSFVCWVSLSSFSRPYGGDFKGVLKEMTQREREAKQSYIRAVDEMHLDLSKLHAPVVPPCSVNEAYAAHHKIFF